MSDFAPGIIAAIVIGGSAGIVLIVVLAVFIPRLQHMKEYRRQYRQQHALRLQRQMKPMRTRGHQTLSKLSTTTATPSVTPSPTDSPTSRHSTSYDELDWMEKYLDGDESGEVASKVHDAFHAIKQVQESNDDYDDDMPHHVTMDIIKPTACDPLQRVGHMKMSLSTTNSVTTNSKGNLFPSLCIFMCTLVSSLRYRT